MRIQEIEVRIQPWYYAKPYGVEKEVYITVKASGYPDFHITEIFHESDTIDTFSMLMSRVTEVLRNEMNMEESVRIKRAKEQLDSADIL